MDVAGSRAGSWYNGPLSKSQENPGLQQEVLVANVHEGFPWLKDVNAQHSKQSVPGCSTIPD